MVTNEKLQLRFGRRLESLAARVRREGGLQAGIQEYLELQRAIFDYQIELQASISEGKIGSRSEKATLEHVETLRACRWQSRRLGDALAWDHFARDKQKISALSHNDLAPIPISSEDDGSRGLWAAAQVGTGPQWGIPLVHDITSCLRIGDITFLNVDPDSLALEHRTVEVKSRRTSEVPTGDGNVDITIAVSMISHSSPPRGGEEFPERPADMPAPAWRPNQRAQRQLDRMRLAVERSAAEMDSITKIEGEHHITLSRPGKDVHHWRELRRAIRSARGDGYAYFSIDGYVGYALHFLEDGATQPDLTLSTLPADLADSILKPAEPGGTITLGGVPLEEDAQLSAETLPFVLYDIPFRAVREVLRHQLIITYFLNAGRVERALEDIGYEIVRSSSQSDARNFGLRARLDWPKGEQFMIETPAPWRDMLVGVHEFLGIESVLAPARAMLDLPNRIPFEVFRQTWEEGRAEREARDVPPHLRDAM